EQPPRRVRTDAGTNDGIELQLAQRERDVGHGAGHHGYRRCDDFLAGPREPVKAAKDDVEEGRRGAHDVDCHRRISASCGWPTRCRWGMRFATSADRTSGCV